jgi:uncharacterized membrane-anchored protein
MNTKANIAIGYAKVALLSAALLASGSALATYAAPEGNGHAIDTAAYAPEGNGHTIDTATYAAPEGNGHAIDTASYTSPEGQPNPQLGV